MPKNLYIVIQAKSYTENKYRAYVVRRSVWDNICNLETDYSNKSEYVVTANVLPMKMAYELAERWNQDYKIQGRLMEL